MTRVLVTGGAGFIGSHLVGRLVADDVEVTVLDNLSTGSRDRVPPGVELLEGDVGDQDFVDLVFSSRKFDAVFHIAGQASIRLSFAAPEDDLRINVLGTLNVVRGCLASGVRRLVNASSMTAYGQPELIPTPESAPCRPVSYYGVAKYAAECYVQITGERNDVGLDVTSLRMFNVYGERQSIDNPYQGVLAIFIGNVLRGEPLTIHGDGSQTRDFVYIDDVVDAWMRVLDASGASGAVFNVGSGCETSVNELADAVLNAFGESRDTWNVGVAAAQLGDQRRSAAAIENMRALGWSPETDLQTGIARTVAWARAGTQGVSPLREARSSNPGSR